ncbi:nucleotidyltransferase family protein [bacterium]|nr:nucleotidyltransferase family protein [bacterium]
MPVTKAILLSAGLGTRLRPITYNIPKCLVPINGTPLLQIWLDTLSEAGIFEFYINAHHLADEVERFIEQSGYESKVTLVYEEDLLGTLGTLYEAAPFYLDDNVLVAHADNLCLCDWTAFFSSFEERPTDCFGTMMVFDTDAPQACGVVELDDSGCVQAFYEKVDNPPSKLANAAVYLFDKTLKKRISTLPRGSVDISVDFMPTILGSINSWKNECYLRDIGTVESLKRANLDMLEYLPPTI